MVRTHRIVIEPTTIRGERGQYFLLRGPKRWLARVEALVVYDVPLPFSGAFFDLFACVLAFGFACEPEFGHVGRTAGQSDDGQEN